MRELMLRIYPIGAIYLSTVATSPAELFGGEWARIEGRFLLAADANHAAGSTGGEETHKLTIGQLPPHSHGVFLRMSTGDEPNIYAFYPVGVSSSDVAFAGNTASAGSGEAFSIMPPYVAVYVWQRVS